MKAIQYKTLLVTLMIALLSTSCSDDDSNDMMNNNARIFLGLMFNRTKWGVRL
ncbi:hypothetical protein [Flavobacterium sediminis]|uniref:hypothetical protein n=1 Tax=Flavobacterium sediminis TaxID=2201181 RepID=UPI0026D0C9BF|nr:hypothetical protein [Flavobacterium sediminis]